MSMKIGFLSLFVLVNLSLAADEFCGWICGGCNSPFQSAEVGLGWRRDNLKWNLSNIMDNEDSGCSCHTSEPKVGENSVFDKFHFNDINIYTVNGKARWVGDCYYIRLEGDYGTTDKGRCHERFLLNNTELPSVSAFLDNHIKRYCEIYDFSLAAGYPMIGFCRHVQIVPLLGFSYHRQRLVVKDRQRLIPNCFDETDALNYGFLNPHRCSSQYRFTWYGGLVGADIAIGLDGIWTLWGEFEYHFGRCHRKRDSNLGADFIDEYHHRGYAQGFNGTIGATTIICTDWYLGFYVDGKIWQSHNNRDKLDWNSVGANMTIGYQF